MINDPTLSVLRALQSIRITGSVSQTAVALGVTQSAISRSISKYEKVIGLQLLRRGMRPLTLTKEGVLVTTHAAEIDRSIQTLVERLETLKQGKEGVVHIGSFGPSASTHILPNLLAQFAKRNPGISVSILEGSDERTRKDLVNGNVDIAVLGERIDEFDAIPIATDQLVALVQDGSRLSTKSVITPVDLKDAPFVMTLAGSEPDILKWFERSSITPIVKHQIQQTHSILALVRAGLGNAIVTSLSLPEEFRGVTVKPLLSIPKREIYFVKQPVSADSTAVNIFWDFLNRAITTS